MTVLPNPNGFGPNLPNPEFALARDHLRRLPAERRAELDREWAEPSLVINARAAREWGKL